MLYRVKSETKTFINLEAVTMLSWTEDGVNVSLSSGGGVNVTTEEAEAIIEFFDNSGGAPRSTHTGKP